jgi:adenosylmethionine-8-amino-7-oxononanoate aminotransferase
MTTTTTVARTPVPDPQAEAEARFPVWLPMASMGSVGSVGAAVPDGCTTLVRGEGVRVWDDRGRVYLDGASGLWNVNCGYGHPRLVEAARHQLDALAFGSLWGGRLHPPAVELARRLVEVVPVTGGRVVYTTSGSSAIDATLKLVTRYQRLVGRAERGLVVGLTGSYHGSTYGSMALTAQDLAQAEYLADQDRVRHVPANEPAALRSLAEDVGDRVAAVVVEPVLGNGAVVLEPAFVDALHELRARHGALVVADEVATGFGRTGTLLACEQVGLRPDVVVLSKGITGGYLPLAAVVVAGHVCDAFDTAHATFDHGETQSGNPVACATALAVLEVMQAPGFLEHAAAMGQRLARGLDRLADGEALVAGQRGLGLMRTVVLRTGTGDPLEMVQVGELLAAVRAEGTLLYAAPSGVAFLPPLVVDPDEIDEMIAGLARGLRRVWW